MSTPIPYNFTLPAVSGMWIYAPLRNAEATDGWNSTFSESTGWPDVNALDTRGQGQNFFRTQRSDAQISIAFDGTGLWFCFTANAADVALTVDGKLGAAAVDATGTPCASTGATSSLSASGLALGVHNAQLRVSAAADREFRFYGGGVTGAVSAAGAQSQISNRTIDDTDGGWSFQPPKGGLKWDTLGGGQDFFNLTTTFNCNYGSDNLTTYSFTGAGAVILNGHAYRDSHDFSITLQGAGTTYNLKSEFSTSGWDMRSQVLFVKSNLDTTATYTVTYRNYNEDNPECRGRAPGNIRFCCVALDSIQLFSADGTTPTEVPDPTDTPSGGKTNVGAIAGGVVGGVALLAAIGLLVVFLLRRRRRRQADEHWDQPHVADGPNVAEVHSGVASGGHGFGIVEPWRTDAPYAAPATVPATVTSLSQTNSTWTGQQDTVRSGKLATLGVAGRQHAAGPPSSPLPSHTTGDPSDGSGSHLGGTSASGTGSGSGNRLAPEDLNHVLAFVAQRMDGRGSASHPPPRDETLPPSYQD